MFHNVICFLMPVINSIKDLRVISIGMLFRDPRCFNTFSSAHQAKYFRNLSLNYKFLWCAASAAPRVTRDKGTSAGVLEILLKIDLPNIIFHCSFKTLISCFWFTIISDIISRGSITWREFSVILARKLLVFFLVKTACIFNSLTQDELFSLHFRTFLNSLPQEICYVIAQLRLFLCPLFHLWPIVITLVTFITFVTGY